MPDIVSAEFKPVSVEVGGNGDPWAHPMTGSTRRYVLGDRFHSTTNPHKSSLCKFHDINLCLQANSLKSFCLRDRGRLGNEGRPISLKIGTQSH